MAFKKGNIYTDANKTNGIYPNTVFSAVYTDDMSTTLGNIASYNATTLVSGANPIEIGVDMNLLWTNASPNSSFAAQTISLNLSEYAFIYINFYSRTTESTSYDIFIKNENNAVHKITNVAATNANYNRKFTLSTSGIAFENEHSNNDSTGTTENNCMIPYEIYGIK